MTHARTNVILAGRRDSRRHSTTAFGGNIVMAKTTYQMLEILSFSDRERASPSSTEIIVLTFVVKKSTMKLSGVSIFREDARKLKMKCPGSRPGRRI